MDLARALDLEFRFRLDAASAGLAAPWAPGPVFCGGAPESDVLQWIDQANRYRAQVVVMVLPARTSATWWLRLAATASEIRFLAGAPEDLAVVVWDERPGPPVHLYVSSDAPSRVEPVAPAPPGRARAMARVLYALRADYTISRAARFARVGRSTVYYWMGRHAPFRARVRAARPKLGHSVGHSPP